MHSNITQRLGERLIHKKQNFSSKENAKSINEELLEMIAHIRSLEDQLLAEQYRQELLLDQNEIHNSKLEKLNSRNEVQRQRIAKLEEEYEMHQVKNSELQICEESLRSIYEEINSLTRIVQNRAEECEQIKIDKNRLFEENEAIREHNFELQQQQQRINGQLSNFMRSLSNEDPKYEADRPTISIKYLTNELINQLHELQAESKRVQREGASSLNMEKEIVIKLQYEMQLLRQRAKDQDKIEKLSEICASQSNLEAVVEQMLVKEDELLDQLSGLEQDEAKSKKMYNLKLQKLKNEQEDQFLKSQGQLKQLQMRKDHLKAEIKQTETRISTKTQKYHELFQEQEMSMKMDINLNSLKRLREVEERNKYLKLKINELQETRVLLRQEKELLHPQF